MKSDGMIKALLIKRGSITEVQLRPSHEEMENLIGTRFWVVRRLRNGGRNDVLFHGESRYAGREDFVFRGIGYNGAALIARYSEYGDMDSALLSLDEAKAMIEFPERR